MFGLRPDELTEVSGLRTFTLTVMGSTDLHGNLFNWDYYLDREFDDFAHNDVGLAKISTLVSQVRADVGRHRTLLLDAGDTIQGTPLAYYYAKVEPITRTHVHPMAAAMNAIGYTAAALGNHEFNYGLQVLRTFERQLEFPLLAANALDVTTGQPAFPPYVIKTVWRTGGPPLRVGILGLTNPGIAVWDRAHVEGVLTFPGLVEQALHWVPEVRSKSDLVVIAAHSGADLSSSLGDQVPFPENCAELVAETVPGVDAVLVGHAHVEIPQRFVTNKVTGRPVLLTEPLFWGKRLSLMEFDLRYDQRWELVASRSEVLSSASVEEDPRIVRLLRHDHAKVVDYVNARIGTCAGAMSASRSRFEDTPALRFINHVQALEIAKSTSLPVVSLCAPFNRAAAIPAGEVSIRDVAGLYIFDNTLVGVRLTGAQLRDFLEESARYFRQVSGPGPFSAAEVSADVPDYNFDIAYGLTAPLTYSIDIAQPVGSRITGLKFGGEPVGDSFEFAVAVNNYRQAGGGDFPHIASAPVLHNQQQEIRQLLIDWVKAAGVLNPADFTGSDWRLVAAGSTVEVTPNG
ncbi:bifunctional metallophosphatase/5'-nucleotidase [Lentzea aerocolonigenes]|uniref:bifunctional metallophosphatase/5'-nucleotidase n=1 Tax=Lentzea aerocolonigenes TaxID=68170 RepID=UPI0009DF01DB|nr:5'-nucleotidase C-terminal domain-containing protein [Lentzea aerocolonigenes]MCP2250187.1 2',3'-cyclic-nucleotide 2'-phosphodiesterase / 3'-nucleotidase [Lentzea aerocolonigenes]